jgi:hypothetical protein
MEDKLEKLNSLIPDLKQRFEDIKQQASEDTKMDDMNVEEELFRTPMLHSKYLNLLSEESIRLNEFKTIQKKLYLERWKYWSGKQTDKYYAEHGNVNDKILKGDIDRYLTPDPYISVISEICEIQKQVVSYVEETCKIISNRGWILKNVIDWRKFESGS